ncbi:hypothetical protein [Aromatoleum petrolei]|uniref:PEGA domain-containing protein n=1 Tax=Aromatoleum petrolei TaxID=76116 RepID=A0ABX1MJW9_9RHOO|nr:hypothetical protein [Aromatoleum petrolei]NMF88265.1 hypothetical protein [Aromatoleum petrolei]
MKNTALKFIFFALLVPLAGCATIMGSDTHVMPISSTPSDASIRITDEKGLEIFKGNTPSTITLKKADGSYFGKKSYTVTIAKAGFETQTIPVTGSPSGWYIGGNLLFGGLIGWLIVDPLNGKMYNLSPENINANLPANPKSSHNNRAVDGGITVMLIQDVPENLRGTMKALN